MLPTLLFLAVIIAVGVIVISRQPEEFRISRQAFIAAAPEAVFQLINDFHRWESWSPWAKMDPNAATTFEGAPEGKGAIMRWNGNMKIGSGSLKITESRPAELIRMYMEFLKPMKGNSTAEFVFQPQEGGTLLTWSMLGKNDFKGKVMSLVFNCEKMVGEKYEEGLANIKAIAEGAR